MRHSNVAIRHNEQVEMYYENNIDNETDGLKMLGEK